MERPSLRRQLVMIFLGIAIPIGILLGLLLFFSGLYSRNRLAAAASGGLDMFTTNFENQLDSVENYLLNLSLNDATFRSLSEQTDRTRAYLDAYEIAQGFPAVLAANDALMGVVLRSGSGNLYVGRYGETAQQLKQKLNLEAYLGQPGQTNKMMTKGWYLRTIGQRLYLLRSVFYQKASLTAAVDLRLVFEELVKDYGLDGRVIVMNDSGNVLVGDANLLPTKMEWNSAGLLPDKGGQGQPTGGAQTGQSADGIVSGSLPAFRGGLCAVSDLAGDGRCFCSAGDPVSPVLYEAGDLCPYDGVGEHHGQDRPR